MDFPLADLMDQDACYARLVAVLHPDGLACPAAVPPTTSASTAATATPPWTTGAATAVVPSTPGPGPPCRACRGGRRSSP
jgi:hypothetical protein